MLAAQRAVNLSKRLEHLWNVFRLDSDAAVRHRYGDVGPAAENVDRDITAHGREFQRIGKQVEQHLAQALIVSAKTIDAVIDANGDADVVAGGLCLDGANAVDDDLQDLDRLDTQFQLSCVEL